MRIAIWIQGGIGGGNHSQGYPPLLVFINGLAKYFDITVYSILPPNEDFVATNFSFRTAPARVSNTKWRTALLVQLFIRDHRSQRFDVIHAFWVYPAGTIAVFLGKIFSIPSIVTVQGGEAAAIKELRYGNMLRPWLKRLTLFTCEKATVLNTISTFLMTQLRNHGLKRHDCVVIPFGADHSRFFRHDKVKALPIRLIHVGNLTEIKDQETIIQAIAVLRKDVAVHLTIIGPDYLNGKLHRLSQELSLDKNITFIGSIPQNQLPFYYNDAHMMLHASLHEGQSGVVMEAMASGVVVCSTLVGIVYDLGSSCFQVVPFQDADGMAKAIFHIWNNWEKFLELQQRAYDYSVTHDAKWTQNEFRSLYVSLKKKKE